MCLAFYFSKDGEVMTQKPSIFKTVKKVAEAGASPKASPLRNLSSMMKEKIKTTEANGFKNERSDKFRVI